MVSNLNAIHNTFLNIIYQQYTCHKESYIGGHNVTRKAYTDLFSVVSISHSRGLPVRDSKAF